MSAEREDDWKPIPEADSAVRFGKIAAPSTVDYALRTVQQGLVHFSAMADTKANILITVCALLFSVGLTQLHRQEIRLPLLVLLASASTSLVIAVLAVLPRFPRPSPPGRREPGRAPFNALFFGHFATLEVEEYLDEMDALMRKREDFYEVIVRDIYGQGSSLARRKYRLLRWSYLALLLGVTSAGLLLLGQPLLG